MGTLSLSVFPFLSSLESDETLEHVLLYVFPSTPLTTALFRARIRRIGPQVRIWKFDYSGIRYSNGIDAHFGFTSIYEGIMRGYVIGFSKNRGLIHRYLIYHKYIYIYLKLLGIGKISN